MLVHVCDNISSSLEFKLIDLLTYNKTGRSWRPQIPVHLCQQGHQSLEALLRFHKNNNFFLLISLLNRNCLNVTSYAVLIQACNIILFIHYLVTGKFFVMEKKCIRLIYFLFLSNIVKIFLVLFACEISSLLLKCYLLKCD